MKKLFPLFALLLFAITFTGCNFGSNSVRQYGAWFIIEGKNYSKNTYDGQFVSKNECIERPENPVIDHFTFDDWYTDETFETKFDFSTPVKGMINIYGKVIPDTYAVTFETNGGSTIEPTSIEYDGRSISFSDDKYKPTKDDYYFFDWYTDKELTNECTEIIVTEDTTLYARWVDKPIYSSSEFIDVLPTLATDGTVYDIYIKDTFTKEAAEVLSENDSVRVSLDFSFCNSVNRIEGCTGIVSVKLNDITTLDDWFFSNCSRLERVSLPKCLEKIGVGAFYKCERLKSIDFPSSLKTIERRAFDNCIKLEKVKLPDGLSSIEEDTFYYCKSLQSVIIPDSVISIGNSAFSYCESLQSITIPSSIIKIGKGSFFSCKSLQTFVIPSSITKIEDGMFCYCNSLVSVEIPVSVTKIGQTVFDGCNKLFLEIPSNVKIIGKLALLNAPNVTFENTDNWYETDSEIDAEDKVNGTAVDSSKVGRVSDKYYYQL